MNQQFRNIVYCSDVSGTGFWRHIQQIMQTNCIQQNIGVDNTYTQTPILDPRYYHGITSVTIQRWISNQHKEIVQKILRPITEQNRAWLIYAIDDAMHYDDIPPFNRGRQAYANDQIQENIKYMLNISDLVVVTTDYIKKYYNRKYGVPLSNIVAAPNLLPRWWFGDRYDPEKKVKQFGQHKAKPRIGIVSSLSHYNIDGMRLTKDGKTCKLIVDNNSNTGVWKDQDNNVVNFEDTEVVIDDLDPLVDMIRSTVKDFQWVFFGYAPPKLKDLIESKKIEYHSGAPILNYPSVIENLQLQAVVAPIRDIEFNRCKSPIKFLECCAAGIPLFASNAIPYSGVMDEKFLFSTADELKDKLTKLKFSSTGIYKSMIESNWKWFNSPRRDGDFNVKNGWLEDNLNIWIDMFKLKPKAPVCSLMLYQQAKQKMNEQEQNKSVVFNGGNGVEILK